MRSRWLSLVEWKRAKLYSALRCSPKLMEIYWIFFYSFMNLQQQLDSNLCGNTNEGCDGYNND